MSDLIREFEGHCRAAGVTPQEALKRGGLHPTNWYRWISGKVSPTLNNFEAAQRGLTELAAARQREHTFS